MSWYSAEDAKWLYGLFNRLVPYWRIFEDQLPRLISSDRRTGANIEILALCGSLIQYGCRERVSAKRTCFYECSGKYVMFSPYFFSCDVMLEKLDAVGLAPTLTELGPFITICNSSITLRIKKQVIRIRRVLLEDVKEDSSITLGIMVEVPRLRTGAWINLVSAPEKLDIVFTSPESEDWERANLSGEEVVSSLLRDEKARRALEDAVHSLAEILKNLPWQLGLAVYLLY